MNSLCDPGDRDRFGGVAWTALLARPAGRLPGTAGGNPKWQSKVGRQRQPGRVMEKAAPVPSVVSVSWSQGRVSD